MKRVGVATLIVVLLGAPASGYQVCLTKSGRIRAPRASGNCGSSQVVDLVTNEDLARSQAAKVPPPAAAGDLRVVDAEGKTAGAVLSVTLGGTLAVRTIAGRPVALPWGPGGLVSLGLDYVYFAAPECSGAPLVIDQETSLMTFPPVLAGAAFVQSGAGTRQTAESFLASISDCQEAGGLPQSRGCCVPEQSVAVLAPAVPMNAAALGMVPPLRVSAP